MPEMVNPDADGIVGSMLPYAGEVVPSPKWRFAHGTQNVSRTEFALLFSRLGERWGVGDGSTTFGLPNMDKKVPVGVDSAGAADYELGDTGGTEAATMPSHTHTISPNPHSHSEASVTFIAGVSLAAGSGYDAIGSSPTTGGTSLTIGNAGGTGDNLPPYNAVRYIIKVL